MDAGGSPPERRSRSEIGRENRKKWRGLTEAGRERLRAAALANRPWLNATGPRTAEGRARSGMNGWARHRLQVPVREQRAEIREVDALIAGLASLRGLVLAPEGGGPVGDPGPGPGLDLTRGDLRDDE